MSEKDKAKIDKLKEELYACIEQSDNLTDERVVRMSQKLDMMMNKSSGVLMKSGDLNSGN